jgi:S-DNA-T family DNA segregation ATPase FtsK/SpoIIIE
MKTYLIIAFIFFAYGAFSTLFHSSDIVGDIGRSYGEANLNLFGYLAYINLIIILQPIYKLYNNEDLSEKIDFYVGWMVFFISLIILESLVLEFNEVGSVGVTLRLFLLPYIGKAGLWLIWLFTFAMALILMVDDIPNLSTIQKYPSLIKEIISEKSRKFLSIIDNIDDLSSIVDYNTNTKKKVVKKKRKRSKSTIDTTPYLASIKKYLIAEKDYILKELKEFASKIENPFFDKKSTEAMNTIVSKNQIKPRKRRRKKSETCSNAIAKERLKKVTHQDSSSIKQATKRPYKPKSFNLPKLNFLEKSPKQNSKIGKSEMDKKVKNLLNKLKEFNIEGSIKKTYTGPFVTTFEFRPAPNIKVSKIIALQDDLAMALSAETIRIQAPIPGRDVVGIEIANESFETIYLRDILESKKFTSSKSPLTIALGKDIAGKPFVTDLKKLPHLLIAGTTGSGKSVGINAMILSLLYRNSPENLKLMLIDPKMLEFSIYDDIPHLIKPVITDAKEAVVALKDMVKEMERRYKLMAENRTKSIDGYNRKAKNSPIIEPMPYIVIFIDELADLMVRGGKDVEYSIERLVQMARASGIHLIVATQRPSSDIITGTIKANLPSRLSYRVGQKIDSKVILDALGADTLLGRGDALFNPPDSNILVRVHSPWNSEEEIERVVEFLKEQGDGYYEEELSDDYIELDELYEEAKEIILTEQKTSISHLQRRLKIGYKRSSNIIEQLQKMGVLSSPDGRGRREILL